MFNSTQKHFYGLLPFEQKNVHKNTKYWKFGPIINNEKKVDRLLHYGCFTLGFNDEYNIIDYVSNVLKNNRPEIAESPVLDEDLFLNDITFTLSEKLYEKSNGYKSFFALSGSDANEGAVKLASAYHATKNNFRKKIVSLKKSYHGSTLLTSSIGFSNVLNDPFYSLDKYHNIIHVERDFEIDSINWNTVLCFIVETCSYGEKLTPFSDDFWKKISYIQNNFDVVIIVDDIFMGGGKTGTYFGWEKLPVSPDIFTMGKAITGGYFPLSITFYNKKIDRILPDNFYWDHGFTYSFFLGGIASALKYLEILEKTELLKNYDDIVFKANDVFQTYSKVINSVGLIFLIPQNDTKVLYNVPLNADQEYFDVLIKNLQMKK